MKREGRRRAQIARALGIAISIVTRECRRNTGGNGYCDGQAEAFARIRAKAKAAKRRKFTEGMWRWAMEWLSRGWSFPARVGQLAKVAGMAVDHWKNEKPRGRCRASETFLSSLFSLSLRVRATAAHLPFVPEGFFLLWFPKSGTLSP